MEHGHRKLTWGTQSWVVEYKSPPPQPFSSLIEGGTPGQVDAHCHLQLSVNARHSRKVISFVFVFVGLDSSRPRNHKDGRCEGRLR